MKKLKLKLINPEFFFQTFRHLLVIFLIFKLLASCEQKTGKVQEKEGQLEFEKESYRFIVNKKGFCFSFQDRDRHVIVPAHMESGLQIGPSPDKMVDAAATRYAGNDGDTHFFSVELADKSICRVEISLSDHSAHFKAIPEIEGRYSILFRAGGVSPGYGLGDGLVHQLFNKLEQGPKFKGTEITGFADNDFRTGKSLVRLSSNFTIYPNKGFAWVNVYPLPKIVRSTESEIVQGSNATSSLDQLYIFLGNPKQIYQSWLQTRNEIGYPVMKPSYALFGVGWEAWGALGWNTNQQSVFKDVNHYLDLGYPLRWMIIGSGFWPRQDSLFHATTSFGMWDAQKYPDPNGLISYFHQKGMKVMLGLRIAFIVGGPFSKEGAEKGYFLKEEDKPKIFKIGFPKSPIHILDAGNPEAVAWYVDLCQRWGVDGFKEDIFGYGKYLLRDDKLNPVNEKLIDKGYLIMIRNNYLGSPGSMHRIEDFNYDMNQDRGAINTMVYPYCGLPFPYPDIIGGLFGGRDFDGDVSPRIRKYMMRNAMWASVHPTMALGKGPWHFKDIRVDSVILKAARLHDRLHPYIYSQAIRFYHDGFPWSMAPLPLVFPDDPAVHSRENNIERGYQWMIGDALLATPLYGDDYETATTRNVYLPEGNWIDYETGKKYKGPVLLENFELAPEKAPLFVGGTGIVVEKESSLLKCRIYPITQRASTIFFHQDGELKSTVEIKNPDWENPIITDKSDGSQVNYLRVRHAFEFDLVPGRDYVIK